MRNACSNETVVKATLHSKRRLRERGSAKLNADRMAVLAIERGKKAAEMNGAAARTAKKNELRGSDTVLYNGLLWIYKNEKLITVYEAPKTKKKPKTKAAEKAEVKRETKLLFAEI